MRRQLFILTTLLVWPIALLATIPPAAPVEDFTLSARKAATRSDGDRMGVVATLKYEKLPDMNLGRMGHQTFATANGLMVVGGHTTDLPSPRRQKSTRTADGTVSTSALPMTTVSQSCSATAAGWWAVATPKMVTKVKVAVWISIILSRTHSNQVPT